MRVIADNLSAIQDLAERQDPSDLVMRAAPGLRNLQHFACRWRFFPETLTDEDSPFNECAHSYLAGAQALLLHLRQMQGGDRTTVDALVKKIDLEMLNENASLILCRCSDEPFNTNEVICAALERDSASPAKSHDIRGPGVAGWRGRLADAPPVVIGWSA